MLACISFKVGGFGIGGITNEITYYLPSTGKWRHLTSIPHVEQCNFGTAVLHNDLYVVGGCFNQSLQVSYWEMRKQSLGD